MANTKSLAVTGSEPQPSPAGSEVVNILLQAEVDAANLASGDLIILGEIPEDCVLTEAVYGFDDLDVNGTPLIVLAFGTINAGETDLDTTIEAAITLAQAGGAAPMLRTVANLSILGGAAGTLVGFKVTTAAATGQAGTALVSLSYRAISHGN